MKCNICGLVTPHDFNEVMANPAFEIKDVETMNEVMNLRKKILMCTQCGSMSLKK